MKRQLREKAESRLQTFCMQYPGEKFEKEMKDKENNGESRRYATMLLAMKSIANHIMNNGGIGRGLLRRKLSYTMTEEEFRRTNVFAYHDSTNSYSFATRALKTVYQASKSSCFVLFSNFAFVISFVHLGNDDSNRQTAEVIFNLFIVDFVNEIQW